MKWKAFTFLIGFLCLTSMLQAFEQKVIQANGLEFWTESFGFSKDSVLLLIMGTGSQGLLWPQKFCEQLAAEGYFVIRFDNRDTGLSSSFDYEKMPYTLLDMATDAITILNGYGIEKAHIVGTSMGGLIAMIMGAHYPKRLHSLTLMATSSDARPFYNAIQEQKSKSPLLPPSTDYLDMMKAHQKHPPKTLEDKIAYMIENQRQCNGTQVPLDEKLWQQLALQSLIRMRNPEGAQNHARATQASFDLYNKALKKIKVPTLIIHGAQDPLLPLDHGQALAKGIPHAQLEIIPGMGHALNTRFYDVLIEKIVGITKVGIKTRMLIRKVYVESLERHGRKHLEP